MQYMQQVQAAGIDNDDPLSSYMLQVRVGGVGGRVWWSGLVGGWTGTGMGWAGQVTKP